jgi:hypothetical protein
MSSRFTAEVEAALRDAGWTPGRRLDPGEVAAMHRAVGERSGVYGGRLIPSQTASEALAEFGGLVIGGDRDGVDLSPRPFAVDPAQAAYSVETLIDAGRALGMDLYPLGVEGMDEAVLAIADTGAVLAIDPTGEWFLGGTVEEALDLLVTGRQPRPVTPADGRRPGWLPPEPAGQTDDLLPLGSLKRPIGAAFFLPRTPANLHYVWLPDTLTRIGVVAAASPTAPGRFEIDDWGGLHCEVHLLDLDQYTVLVLAFDQYDLLDQQAAAPDKPDGTPLARAFRDACAAFTPDLEVAFVQQHRTHELLRHVADRELDVQTLDGDELLAQGYGLLYLTARLDFGLAPDLVSEPRDELPITGGRLLFGGSGQGRWG